MILYRLYFKGLFVKDHSFFYNFYGDIGFCFKAKKFSNIYVFYWKGFAF